MIRSVLYLSPRNGDASALAEAYRRRGVLNDAAGLEGCLGTEFQVPLGGSGPVLVTGLWRDPAAYREWLDSPVRAIHGDAVARFIDAEPGTEIKGQLYEIIVEPS